jgi:ATP-binding cassette subfamily F protein uup
VCSSDLAKAVQAAKPEPKKPAAKLSYKDQRRLEELDALVHRLPGDIAKLEAQLADPDLYRRDPAGFDRIMKAGAAARAELTAAEEAWLVLAEKSETLGS